MNPLNFAADYARLLKPSLRSSKSLIASVAFLDLVGALSKISSVLIIALAVKVVQNDSSDPVLLFLLDTFNVTSNSGSPTLLIVILGGVMGITTLTAVLLTFQSFKISRRIGRINSERVQGELLESTTRPPRLLSPDTNITADNLQPNVGIRLFTQVPLHCGLGVQSLIRLINPLLILVSALFTLLIINAYLALILLVVAVLIFPFYLRFGQAVQSNAKNLYNDNSSKFGAEISSIVRNLSNQNGILDRRLTLDGWNSNTVARATFFDSLDMNLLSTQRISMYVGFADALARPLLLVTLCLLVLYRGLSTEEAVVVLGCLALMFSSARVVSSLTSNLMKYRPQVKAYLAEKTIDEQEVNDVSEFLSVDDSVLISPGSLVCLHMTQALETRVIEKVISKAFRIQAVRSPSQSRLIPEILFVSAKLTSTNMKLVEQLTGSEFGQSSTRKAEIKNLCKQLGVWEVFESSDEGLQTRVTAEFWDSLPPLARFALRVVPLCSAQSANLVVIQAEVLKSGGAKAREFCAANFSQDSLIIASSDAEELLSCTADLFAIFNDSGEVATGDREWFAKTASTIKSRGRNGEDLDLLDELLI